MSFGYSTQTFSDYNRFTGLPSIPYNIVQYLFNNDNLMKLLYYNTSDALSQPNLTDEQKRSMIYNGEVNADDNSQSTNYKIFLSANPDDAISEQTSMLRVYKYRVMPTDKIVSKVVYCFELINHVKLMYLDNYTLRYENMFVELMRSLNGANGIQGISPLVFDKTMSSDCESRWTPFNNVNYQGERVTMCTTVSFSDNGSGCF